MRLRVLRALGLEAQLRRLAFKPAAWTNRVWDTGELVSELTFGAEAEARYGAPYLLMHRGDLHAALFSVVPPNLISFNKKLADLERTGSGVTLRFSDGSSAHADAVVGADGVHSRVREILGPDRHIVIYPVNPARDETYFVTSVPDPAWDVESWSARGDMAEVRAAFVRLSRRRSARAVGVPARAQMGAVRAGPAAALDGEPGRAAGRRLSADDALHGAGRRQRLEGAAVLSRCIAATADPADAFPRYEATRLARTSRIQLTSRQNTWGKERTDPSWVYGYDACAVPIAEAR